MRQANDRMETVEDDQRKRRSFDDVPRRGAADRRVDGHVLRTFHLEHCDDEHGQVGQQQERDERASGLAALLARGADHATQRVDDEDRLNGRLDERRGRRGNRQNADHDHVGVVGGRREGDHRRDGAEALEQGHGGQPRDHQRRLKDDRLTRALDVVGGRNETQLTELGCGDDDGRRADREQSQLGAVGDKAGVELVTVCAGRVERVLTDDEVAADGHQRQNEHEQPNEQTSVCLARTIHPINSANGQPV